MLLRNQTNSHNLTGASIQPSSVDSESRKALQDVASVLGLPDSQPAAVLSTVQKLEKVVKAVPRMEHFIHNVSLTMGEEDGRPLPLEKVLPLLTHWKAIVQHAQ